MEINISSECEGHEQYNSRHVTRVIQQTCTVYRWPEIEERFKTAGEEYSNLKKTGEVKSDTDVDLIAFEFTINEIEYYVEVETIEDIMKILKEHNMWVLSETYINNRNIGFTTCTE
jgi:hypothetical protein